MAHAVSVFFIRSQHIPPQAFLLALLLHGLTVLTLWWLPTLNPFESPTEDAIEVTIEQPQSPPPPPPVETQPPAQAAPPPPPLASPSQASPLPKLGILPPTQSTPTPDTPKATTDETTQQPSASPEQSPQQEALAPPQPPALPPPPPPPQLEQALPPLEAPPPPLSARDFPKPAPPPKPPAPQRATAPPPLRPSPLSSAPQRRPPTDSQASAPTTTFVNPADAASRGRAKDDYLWRVARQFSQYRYYSNEKHEEGTVIARLTIARDGRLLDVGIDRSSGFPTLDKGVIETIRVGAPYPPLPVEIPGDPVTFVLPVTARYRQ